MYIYGHFDDVSAIRKPKIIMFSLTGSQIFLQILLFLPQHKDIPCTGIPLTTLKIIEKSFQCSQKIYEKVLKFNTRIGDLTCNSSSSHKISRINSKE